MKKSAYFFLLIKKFVLSLHQKSKKVGYNKFEDYGYNQRNQLGD